MLQLFAEEAVETAQLSAENAPAEAAPETAQVLPEAAEKPAEADPPADPMAPALELLEQRYRVPHGDRQALADAISRENEMRQSYRNARVARGADRLYDSWMQSAGLTKETYPDFDLSAELKSPAFTRLLRSGVDVKTAYEVLHKDEIIPAAMQYAARTVESRLAGAMASSSLRPAENGMGSHGAVIIGSNVNSLSRRDIADIARRVERGERISFG